MATNQSRWVKNLFGATGPLLLPGLFGAGSTTAIKRGELLELTNTGNTIWVPMDSDYDMSAAAGSGGKVMIANEEVKSGDLAGWRLAIAPRPGDVFRFELLSTDTQNPAIGTAVYWSSSEIVSTTAGTNIIGHIVGFGHYPIQGHQADDASVDKGTTRTNLPGREVWITIEDSNGYYRTVQQA